MAAEPIIEPRNDGTLLHGERKVLELIASGAPLSDTLDALCEVIDEQTGLMSSVFLLNREGDELSQAAGPHLPQPWRDVTRSFRATPINGACGAAVNRRERVVVADALDSPLNRQWRDAVRRAGIGSMWSTPFFSRDGCVLGTFAVVDRQSRNPSDSHLSLVARATHLASIAIERHQTETGLRESERRFSKAFHANPACMTITRFSDGRFLYVNDAFVRMFGYSRAEAIGQTALGLGLYANAIDRPHLMRLLDDRKLQGVEARARTRSGEILDVVVSMERIEVQEEESVLQIAVDITERKRAEEALRETEARFRQIVEHIHEVIWMSTADFGSVLYVSPGYEAIWGRSCGTLREAPRSWIDAVHAEDRDRVAAVVEREGARGFAVEYRVVQPDGSIRWVWDRRFPIKDQSGHVYRVAGIAEDITERKRINEQLRSSEQALAEAQHVAGVGSWTWDLRSQTVAWSDELYRLFGVEPGGLDPLKETMSFVHPDDRDLVRNAVTHALATREAYSFFYRIRRPDGEVRNLHSRGYIVGDDHGDAVSAFGTTQDVTDRRQAEEALRRSEQLLRQVLDALPVGVAVVDPEGNTLLSNPAVTSIWGADVIQSGEERYRRSKGWWHDTGKRIAPDEWASVRARLKGETSINEVIDIETFDGARKIIQNSSVPIRDEQHAIVGAVVINEDISAAKSAERDLEASASQMQALATRLMNAQDDERRNIAQMLHETTAQDLAALKMHLARLTRTAAGLSDADRAALTESIDLAERSMTGIRTLSYLLHPPFLDEAGLLSALRWYAAGFAARSGVKVDLDLPSTFDRLPREVETALFRVVQEALINVHRHAGSETASIRLRLEERRLTLEIEDRGRGMPAMVIAQLPIGGGGLGVGVTGMRERLQQLGGTLDIESSERGTTIRARIPLDPEAA